MEWTPRFMGTLLLAATGVELGFTLAVSVATQVPVLQVLAPVLIFMGIGWTVAGMLVSGPGRVTPPLTLGGSYGSGGGAQPSLASELYISRAGADRLARESVRSLDAGSGFMIPAVLYGVALFAIGLWLAA